MLRGVRSNLFLSSRQRSTIVTAATLPLPHHYGSQAVEKYIRFSSTSNDEDDETTVNVRTDRGPANGPNLRRPWKEQESRNMTSFRQDQRQGFSHRNNPNPQQRVDFQAGPHQKGPHQPGPYQRQTQIFQNNHYGPNQKRQVKQTKRETTNININNNSKSNTNSNSNNNSNSNSNKPNNITPISPAERITRLILELRKSATKPTSSIETPTPSTTPPLRPRFLRPQGQGESTVLPPLQMNREFTIRPQGNETILSPTALRPQMIPRTPRTHQHQQQQHQNQQHGQRQQHQQRGRRQDNRNTNYRPPMQQDGLDFLEGRIKHHLGTPEKSTRAPEPVIRTVTLPAADIQLTAAETALLFRIKADDILAKLELLGTNTSAGKETRLDVDTLEILATEFDIKTIREEDEIMMDNEELLMHQRRTDDDLTFPPRPPVVCIMGHVDHGKTTLMDALRRRSMGQQNPKVKKAKDKQKKKGAGASTDVAGTEAGGITQVISAFQVDVEGQDNKVTFLDTPGHAAFKSMRQSGSHAADVIVLVVAADDGVSEQTIEILDFYKSIVTGSNGGISMMVALNKIDKPGIDLEEAKRRVENQLLEQGILCEGMSGESEFGPPVQVVPTSGLTGQGLDELIEGLVLQSEVMDLRADHDAHAEGIVMDARMEKGLGVVADCIIRWGSIKKGDVIVSGTQASRVRMLKDGK